jgi:hypothetical protein
MPKIKDIAINESTANSFVSEARLARHWDISGRTLQRWRSLGHGPRFRIIGGSVRYRIRDILEYEAQGQKRAEGDQ